MPGESCEDIHCWKLLLLKTLVCHLLDCEKKPKLQLSTVTMDDYNREESISSNKGPEHINSFSSLHCV